MSNLPKEHHRMNAHARHLEKALATLLWVLRFRWTCASVIDALLGGNGTVHNLVKHDLLVRHKIRDPFSPVRYYVTLSAKGLKFLFTYISEVHQGDHGSIASALASGVTLPVKPDQRIRQGRFLHDLQLQKVLVGAFHSAEIVNSLVLGDDLERLAVPLRPRKIPDAVLELKVDESRNWCKYCIEIENSRKNQREVDNFCAYYRTALADPERKDFDKLLIYCERSLLAGWRSAFARTIIPKWIFNKERRTWVRLDKDKWHHFEPIPPEELDNLVGELRT